MVNAMLGSSDLITGAVLFGMAVLWAWTPQLATVFVNVWEWWERPPEDEW